LLGALGLAIAVPACGGDAGGEDAADDTTGPSDDGDGGADDDGDDPADDAADDGADADDAADDGGNDDAGDGSMDDTGGNDDGPADDDGGSDDGGMMGFGPSPGCGTTPGSITSGTITAGNLERTYILQLPDDYDPNNPYPLVFGFHGFTEDMEVARWRFRVGEEWGGQAIGIYPQGRYFANLGGNNWEYGSGTPDMALFDALANAAAEQLCIDLDRIFVTGFSAGGYFVHSLMCYRGDYIRAAGPAGAGMVVNNCGSGVPMWSAHATNDEVVPYNAGTQLRTFWLERNGCGGDTQAWPQDGHCVEYSGCADPLVWCDYEDGHWWDESWKSPGVTAFFQQFGPIPQ
jgi:poly(3-hydroxybutyrate) depolymerase